MLLQVQVCEALCLLLTSGRVSSHTDAILSVLGRTVQKHRSLPPDCDDKVLESASLELVVSTVRSSVSESQAQASGIL